ncbi:MAG: ATP-dependent RecD-like DNA helicase, partial [Oscillospiraceae bacterium]|nr:ATP-dependent RecD-like DNA helicase [Oscillospiraceae bacterium]
MDGDKGYIQIEGTVSSVVYRNPENGYAVLRLDTPDGGVTAVGCMPDVFPGETLTLTGEWAAHHTYGEQFKAELFTRGAPAGADAIYKYLASGVIRGIGPAKAKDIVDKFGAQALEVLETEPAKLSAIRGITARGARELGVAFRRTAGVRRLIESLTEYGVKPLIAMRLYRTLGDDALDAVRENPYILADRQFGAEFHEADAMALKLGFEQDCPQRVQAAVLFEMRHNTQNGHTFLPYGKLAAATGQLIGTDGESIEEALDALCEEGEVVREEIAGQDACYLRYMYEDEHYAAQKLLTLARNGGGAPEALDALIAGAERAQGVQYAAEQRRAVTLASNSCVMALTGGPGTGKTTSVRGILALFDGLGLKTLLCAPTGRAAKRLSQLANRPAATVHRALGAGLGDDGELLFEYGEDNPLKTDAVIVDEASMLDLPLTRALLEAVPKDCRLVFVGDADQLPSVGPGNIFSDIIKSGAVPVVTL